MKTPQPNPCGFNPATSGFAAKVWECMRRNRTFCADVEKTRRETRGKKPAAPNMPDFVRAEHPCSYFVGTCLIRGNVTQRPGRQPRRIELTTPWPQLPEEFRARLTAQMTTGRLEEVNLLQDHNGDDVEFRYLVPYYDEDMPLDIAWRNFAESLNLDHKVILVPRLIRDSDHRKALIKQFADMLPKPRAKSGRKFAKEGTALGSAAEWDAFLVYQAYLGQVSPVEAKAMASWYSFGRDDFMAWKEADRTSLAGIAQAMSHYAKQTTHIGLRITAITKAIDAVYPAFRPGIIPQ